MTNDNIQPRRVIDLAEMREAKRLAQAIPADQFGEGPWRSEPSFAEWVDQDSGYPCMVVRDHSLGHLCGYVGVFQGHPAYGQHYDTGVVDSISVHGGLTYSSFKGGRRRAQIVKPGEPWWFGFDCAHAGDIIPAIDVGALKKYKTAWDAELKAHLGEKSLLRPDILEGLLLGKDSVYRTFAWVTGEVGLLVQQLRELE